MSELSPNNCPICKDNFVLNNKALNCGFCKKRFHNMCARIKDTLLKAVLDFENLLWFCDGCIRVVNKNLSTAIRMDQIDEKINVVIKAVEKLQLENRIKNGVVNASNTSAVPQSKKYDYAKALKEGVVVVKPTKLCESLETKKIVKEQIRPADLGIGITAIKNAKEGAVVIKCRNEAEAKKLKENLEPKIRQNFLTTVPTKKRPRIKIVGIEDLYNEEELILNLRQQNPDVIGTQSEMRLIVSKKMVNAFFAILECDFDTFRRIQDEGRVFLGCRTCRCYEYINVVRCFNCNQYNHTSKECKIQKVCGKCGANGHDTKDCVDNNLQCINCKNSNSKFKLQLDTNHTVFDLNCPTYVKLQEKEKLRIQYCPSDK